MLAITRREEESLLIYPPQDMNPDTTVAELFKNGPIEIIVNNIRGSQVRLGIKAPRTLTIMRPELLERSKARQTTEAATD